ncbi:hypothetical protein WJX75_000279 [Coccomyxa subellipsoidea]|uniref:Kinase-like protein n=1 Tax=Coccomyxa subellipsoidea TaxID=248742 RepID=A0ABR2Z055_9CHLO
MNKVPTAAWLGTCGISLRQGRRAQMEDRAVCVEEWLDRARISAGVYAVYDGHNGNLAAQVLSTRLHEAVFDALAALPRWPQVSHTKVQEVLRAALLAVNDEFLSKASLTEDQSGSTAVAALRVGHQYVVGHVGDSRALLCQHNNTVLGNDTQSRSTALTLTWDHTPARKDESTRILAAGGTVTTKGTGDSGRLQGELAVSRSVGDVQYRPFGLTAEPEFSEWHEAGPTDEWLILASDGIFEALTAGQICDIAAATMAGVQHTLTVTSPRKAIPLPPNGSNSPAEEHIVGIAVSLEQQGLGDAIIPVPRRSTSPVACSLIDTKGVPHQYELKELLALVPRNPSPTNSDAASRIAHASLSEGSDQQGSTAGQKAISTASADEASCGKVALTQIQWALHTGQLQLAPAAAELVQGLASLPLQPAGWEPAELGWALAEDDKPHQRDTHGATFDYMLESQRFAQGGFGEVWRAERRTEHRGKGICDEDGTFVLKHILVNKGEEAHLSGLREAYFGKLLQGSQHVQAVQGLDDGHDHITRFVEVLADEADLWLVFCDEGISLHSLIYSSRQPDIGKGGPKLLEPSKWWWAMRTEPHGEAMLRDILRQTLLALEILHTANVTHRDVKPENLLLQPGGGEGKPGVHLRLIDFGSAIDAHTVRQLYGTQGPSVNEQTQEYAPPEALLGRYWTGEPVLKRTWPYDMWSLGVSWLELVLGTRHVFQVDAKTRARLYQKINLEAMPEEDRKLAFWLRGLMELCIYPPRPLAAQKVPGNRSSLPLPWSCTDQALLEMLKQRDPSGKGLPSVQALRLLTSLLHWNPAARPTPQQALRHAFFVLPLARQDWGMPTCTNDRSQPGWC